MTRDEAEDIFMAWQAGLEGDKAKIAEAVLILSNDEDEKDENN